MPVQRIKVGSSAGGKFTAGDDNSSRQAGWPVRGVTAALTQQRRLQGIRIALSRDGAPAKMDRMRTLYEAAGGMDGMRRLAHAWHLRVLDDEVVAHAFSHGFNEDHTERLAAYWGEALGGPAAYSSVYGDETSVVRIHSGNGVHEEMDRRAINCFDQALVDVGIDRDGALGRALHDYFAWATTVPMARYHHSADDVPGGLRIPRWAWNGLEK